MKTIYFVRHGETEGNTGKLFQGPNTPLNEKGKAQAKIVAERCARLPVEVLISSTMKRALETAGIISNRTKMLMESSDLFIERKRPTKLADRSASDEEARALEKEWRDSFMTDGRKVEDSETFFDVRARAKYALNFLESRVEKKLLVVTHGFFLQALVSHVIFGDDLIPSEFKDMSDSFQSTNTGITVFEFDPEIPHPWYILVWNDHAHLG